MLPNLKRDADGGITLYIQNQSSGKENESNWLPAPHGPFFVALRLYWPKPEALDGEWKAPPLDRVPQNAIAPIRGIQSGRERIVDAIRP